MENNLKKNRHLLNALSLILRITIICFILLLLYAAWPSLHPESFQVFRSWIDHLSQGHVYTTAMLILGTKTERAVSGPLAYCNQSMNMKVVKC